MNWLTKDYVFYILMYRSDLDFSVLPKRDIIEMLNVIRLHYIERMGKDDDFEEFSPEFKAKIHYWLRGRN